MLGLGLSIPQAAARRPGLGGAVAPAQRIVPVNATSFYVMAANARGTAFAHRFIRNIGGSEATDVGQTVNQPWRYVGTAEFPSTLSDPTGTPLFIYSNDTGAQDYAFSGSLGKWLGSYHGGETVGSWSFKVDGVPVDPLTSNATGSQAVLTHSSTITDGTNTITITDFSVTVGADGNLTFSLGSASSTSTLNPAFIGMGIATGTYDEGTVAIVSGGTDYKVPIKAVSGYGRLYALTGYAMRVRSTATGRAVRIASNAPGLAGYKRSSFWRDTGLNRTKTYFDLGSASALGTKSGVSWTVSFETGPAGASTFGSTLITNGGFTSDLTGWTATHNPSGVTWNAGTMRITRSASAESRAIQAVSGLVAGDPYLLSGEAAYSPSTMLNPGGLGLTSNSNGSTSTPVPAYAPLQFQEPGWAGHIVVPTLATHYAMALMSQGTAGQIVDLDNVEMRKLAA